MKLSLVSFTIVSYFPSSSGLPGGLILSIFLYLFESHFLWRVLWWFFFCKLESWLSSSPGSIVPFTTRHGCLEYCFWSSSLFSRYLLTFLVISNWVSRNSALLFSAIILFFVSWYCSCCWFVLGVDSDRVVEENVSGVGMVILLYFDYNYNFLRSRVGTFLL